MKEYDLTYAKLALDIDKIKEIEGIKIQEKDYKLNKSKIEGVIKLTAQESIPSFIAEMRSFIASERYSIDEFAEYVKKYNLLTTSYENKYEKLFAQKYDTNISDVIEAKFIIEPYTTELKSKLLQTITNKQFEYIITVYLHFDEIIISEKYIYSYITDNYKIASKIKYDIIYFIFILLSIRYISEKQANTLEDYFVNTIIIGKLDNSNDENYIPIELSPTDSDALIAFGKKWLIIINNVITALIPANILPTISE